MRFKVNNRYVVDAKSHDDAIRVVKMLDAMETYSIRWIDTYAKSQGYGPDFWRYDAEIKANNVKEALEKLAKKVALGGTGTANCLVMHVSNSHAAYQFSGRLSELLKKTKEQLGDSVKDAEPETDVDLDFLIKDEIEAIDGYRKMIAKASNPQLLSVLSHILDEETEHVEELRAAQAGVYEVNVDDSIHDRLGEGKCAPTGTVSLASFAEDAAEFLENVQKNTSDPLYENKLAFAKRKYDQIKNMIERERQEIDDFDRYWQSHKAEMTANILAAKKALR